MTHQHMIGTTIILKKTFLWRSVLVLCTAENKVVVDDYKHDDDDENDDGKVLIKTWNQNEV